MAFLTETPPVRSVPLVERPGIRRLVAPNPGPMTYHGTNSWLIGTAEGVVILDPGPADPGHLDAIARAAQGRAALILLSHGHADHAAGAAPLADMLKIPVLAHEAFRDEAGLITQRLRHGDEIAGLTCLHTPGHSPDHLCFALPDGVVFTGDHVMAWSSSVVPFPSGNMAAFLASLAVLRDRGDRLHLPGHGPALLDPASFIDELIRRRLGREAAILSLIEAVAGDETEIVRRLYAGRAAPLFGAALHNVRSHLAKLGDEGLVCRDASGCWSAVPRRVGA
ncbi:MAG: MBL fold metallo-hydrolase [Pseudorhodobacter sp.]|nr:MAG: MBL fold metallo-hydrolase [Pseudorhodobacter sp.]